MKCKNCEHNLDSNFCKNCGQKSNTKKINLRYLIDELQNSVFQINRGFFFTIKEFCIRPGHSIREFIEGKRKNHFKPIAFIFLTSTLYVLLNHLIENDTFMDDFINGMKGASNGNDNRIFNLLTNNKIYIILVIVPFVSLASYFAFVKSKYNYFEHLVLNSYITGQQILIYMAFSFISFRDSPLTLIPIILGMLFNFWTYKQFFNKKSSLKVVLQIILTYIILILELLILMIIIGSFFIN